MMRPMLPTTMPFRAGEAAGRPHVVHLDGDRLSVVTGERVALRLRQSASAAPRLAPEEPLTGDAGSALPLLMAAFEAVSAAHPDQDRISLDPAGFAGILPLLRATGLAVGEGEALSVRAAMLWQRPEPWLANPEGRDFPAMPVMTEGRRHPMRAPKPTGLLYQRFIPWLGLPVAFRAASPDDVDLLHRWMNDPRVDAVWAEAGPRARHEAYLAGLIGDPHMLPLIGSFGGEPFGYFEVYWAKENRLAPFYEVRDYDRGWHVLVGEESFRGRPYVSAWLPSLMHALFLDDPRTDRIVGEPRADHVQQLRNLERSGFARIKTFDFPHKRAALVMLLRERFFCERLWAPNLPQVQPAVRDDATPEGRDLGAAA